MKYKYCT